MKYSLVHRNSVKSITTAAIGFAVFAVLGASAQAGESRKPKQEMRSVYLVKYRVNNEIRYAKKSAGKTVKVSASQYMNNNPYVCTPSGFGQKARCYTPSIFKRPNV
ncbi:hypothetical protein N8E89_19115 (plasmid) [Phyllobacterium sp. A18/5-2]|uniref:hypothetical protein n=1 Tax=Phyllobacterium sp. A18/5-2 TaxID=2978392 RepID=UPI0021C68187|nr:hypothetical protein [Phyllobacterium sp. A18/5-2]UXN66727.1 hypothetical protein N8E89_19115 [Phyllobacterium sp. A18/5-2]